MSTTKRGTEVQVDARGATEATHARLAAADGTTLWVTRVPCVGERICIAHPSMGPLGSDRALVVVDVLHWTGQRPGGQLGSAALITVREDYS